MLQHVSGFEEFQVLHLPFLVYTPYLYRTIADQSEGDGWGFASSTLVHNPPQQLHLAKPARQRNSYWGSCKAPCHPHSHSLCSTLSPRATRWPGHWIERRSLNRIAPSWGLGAWARYWSAACVNLCRMCQRSLCMLPWERQIRHRSEHRLT